MSPLSTGRSKLVCDLTRLMQSTASASAAFLSKRQGMPFSVAPYSTVSMVARIGAPTLASVTPRWASTPAWPSAVAPPWLPIAGTMNG